jgi:hypothetical protein
MEYRNGTSACIFSTRQSYAKIWIMAITEILINYPILKSLSGPTVIG